jgi:purine-binding chemotaxis protein CheW
METESVQGTSQLAGKYLSFSLAGETYGIEILSVQEIIGVMHLTTVPKSAGYLKGVINLRGKIIPVIDLRLKFGLPEASYDEKTCIIVANAVLGGRQTAIGIAVDTVLEVRNFQTQDIEAAPEYAVQGGADFVVGMGRTGADHIVILIDIEKALSGTGGATLSEGGPEPRSDA